MKTPFGNSVAAIKLAEIVENNPRSRRYVSSTLSELGSVLRNLFSVQELPARRYLCRLVQNQFVERVKASEKLSPEEASFLMNVIMTRCRSYKKHFDAATD